MHPEPMSDERRKHRYTLTITLKNEDGHIVRTSERRMNIEMTEEEREVMERNLVEMVEDTDIEE